MATGLGTATAATLTPIAAEIASLNEKKIEVLIDPS
jgi:hypothetical protein